MTQQSMHTFQDGEVVIADFLNPLVHNIGDHETRVSTLQSSDSTQSSNIANLQGRVGDLESASSGPVVTASGFLGMDPNNVGFKPTTSGQYQVYDAGRDIYIEFPNPGVPVTVYGIVAAHAYSESSGRCGLMIDISLNGGVSWNHPSNSPLTMVGMAGVTTNPVVGQFCYGGTPTGSIRVRALGMYQDGTIQGFFRPTLYANMLGGNSFSTGR